MRRLAACLVSFLLLGPCAPAQAAPGRVVSMNLCTDQLAMLLAAPGQLVSVSYLAADPRSSAMAAEAAGIVVNHGLAEEVFLHAPDLVLAGSFTTRATVDMLRRLGVPVLELPPAGSLAEARAQILEIGAALGREAQAARVVARLDAALAAHAAPEGPRPTAAAVGANGYASGPASLAGEVIAAAGLDNVLGPMGYESGGRIALEELVMNTPDLMILPEPWPGWSQAEEFPNHPALDAAGARIVVADRNWVCPIPALIENLDALAAARRALAAP